MAIIVSRTIRKREFDGAIAEADRAVIVRSARVALATPIAGAGLPSGTRLLKAYATSKSGVRRVVFLLSVEDGDLMFLFYRGKNDKIGRNITVRNPEFKAQLLKYLTLLKDDLASGNYDVIPEGV